MPALVRRLVLTNFRNYRAATLEAGTLPIVLCGPNGAGKTNLIEAISFLTPGRGLRRATLEEIACNEGDGSWAVSAEVEGALGLATLGTGIERQTEDDAHGTTEVPHRSRAGWNSGGIRRSHPHHLDGAGDGFAVQRRAIRTPPVS